jgi:uncharacterized RDD family membrane protein YckC
MNNELLDDLTPKNLHIYVGFWRRLGATFLDVIILSILLTLGTAFTALLKLIAPVFVICFLQEICSLMLLFLYYPLLESSKFQGSIGKQILGMKVVDKEGQRIKFWRALVRQFSKVLSFIAAGTGFFMIAFMDKKRGFHDLLVDTYVIER